uniref:Uncharacterized protein n=1 Tax=Timema douglasi TaxID=61478 RepID=A0A7R8VLX2_TIMDO|nr:unnamed protein product [Timema douglasi]
MRTESLKIKGLAGRLSVPPSYNEDYLPTQLSLASEDYLIEENASLAAPKSRKRRVNEPPQTKFIQGPTSAKGSPAERKYHLLYAQPKFEYCPLGHQKTEPNNNCEVKPAFPPLCNSTARSHPSYLKSAHEAIP